MMWNGTQMGGWGYAAMGVGNLVFWAAVIIGGIVLFRYLRRTGGPGGPAAPRSTPEQVLAERYARGEINDGEYRSRLSTLRDSSPMAPAP